MLLTPDMVDMVADEHEHDHCQCTPLWAKIILPILASAFVCFVVVSQLQQIKRLTDLQSASEAEIREMSRIRDMRDREFVDLKVSMQVRNVLFREIGTHVGVTPERLDQILADDPMAPPKDRP